MDDRYIDISVMYVHVFGCGYLLYFFNESLVFLSLLNQVDKSIKNRS